MQTWTDGVGALPEKHSWLACLTQTINTAEPEFKTVRMGGGDICAFDKKRDLWEKKKEQV